MCLASSAYIPPTISPEQAFSPTLDMAAFRPTATTKVINESPVDSLDDEFNSSEYEDEQAKQASVDAENEDQDEGFNNELQLDCNDQEQQTTTFQITDPIPIPSTSHFDLHPLLQSDIQDVFSQVSTRFLAGFSHQSDTANRGWSIITFHFFTDYIDTETACQWQICNKNPLTCEILVNNKHYLDEKVIVEHVYQICDCHPANVSKVSFIDRFVRDYFEKNKTILETLKLSRAALNPDLCRQYFLEIIPDQSKRTDYETMLLCSDDNSLLKELIENEILRSNERIAKKLQLLKPPRRTPSDALVHYDLLDVKHLPRLDHGYLVQFCRYFEYRLRNLNSLCVMCGKRVFDSNDKKAFKPAICDDYECFSNAMDSKFRNDPLPPSIFSIEIADFLLLLVHAAVHSNRHALVLDPYPKLINPYNTSTTLIDQNGNKTENIADLIEIIGKIIAMNSITQYEAVKIPLRSMLELQHPWAFSFFHWLMGTNRYHFSLIPLSYQIHQMGTKYQYFIKHEDIDKHVNFKKLREAKGSVFAYHGSPQENWHSILRSGLQIGKGGYLLNGAAYGAGVYVSPSFTFSLSYTQSRLLPHSSYSYDYSSTIDTPPLKQRNWTCIALCEIIDSPDVYKKHTNNIWTIQDPKFICTRFIFFYKLGEYGSGLRVESATEVATLRQLIHTLNNIAC